MSFRLDSNDAGYELCLVCLAAFAMWSILVTCGYG
jgi:hypothetical protein